MKINYIYVLAVAIIAASIFLRTDNLLWETYGYGELEVKEAADSYAAGNFVNNFYIFDTPPFGKYIFAAATIILGSNEFNLRMVSVVFGVLIVLSTFFFTKKLYDIKMAILATSVTGFSLIHLQFSRYIHLETLLGFLYLAIIYFLWSMAENKRKQDYIFLGVSLGLAIATKFTSIIMFVIVVVYFIYIKNIKFSIKPNFSISVNNDILKMLAVAFILFMILWPFGLTRLHTEATVTVDYGDTPRTQQVQADIPIIVLSFLRRVFSSVGEPVAYSFTMGTPVINYILLYLTKEFILIIPMIIAGTYFMIKKPSKNDMIIFFTIVIFILSLSLQRTSISYRHITPLVPFLAIVASRWIYELKFKWQTYAIVAVPLIFFIAAITVAPSYALSFNVLKEPLEIQDSELRFSEGMRETIDYIKSDCNKLFTNNYYRYMVIPYFANVTIDKNESADCAIKGSGMADLGVSDYVRERQCTLARTVSKANTDLIEIYRCSK